MKETLTVEHMLSGNLAKKYRDKVFWYASSVKKNGNTLDINIDNQNIVAFDNYVDGIKGAHAINELVILGTTEIGSKPIKNVLVSSGSFLWVNNKLLVTQRTTATKYDPLAWTTPAGRCDDTPLRTALKETIEEIQIQSKKSKKVWMPELSKSVIANSPNINFYSCTPQFPKKMPHALVDVRTWLDGNLIEETQLWYFYNSQSNTLEFRLPIVSHIDEELIYTNPEFHTETKAVDLNWLTDRKLVPALKKLL